MNAIYHRALIASHPAATSFLVGTQGATNTLYTGTTLAAHLFTFHSLRGKNHKHPNFRVGSHVWSLQYAKCTQLNNCLWLATKLS